MDPTNMPAVTEGTTNQEFTLIKDGTMISDEKGQVLDLLHYNELEVQVRVKIAANSGQTLQLQHSAVNEDGAFAGTGSTFDLATTGNKVNSYGSFLRYIRLVASGSISTQPTLTAVLVAKGTP